MGKDLKDALVRHLQERGVLKTSAITDAFLEIDRKDFLPENVQEYAYVDEALPIGEEQTVSQPYTVAFMLELLDPEPGHIILDSGAGSGWQTSILAHIVSLNNTKGKIYSFEIVPFLCDFGKENVSKYNFIKKGIVGWYCADASLPPKDILFDRIISAASILCNEEDVIQCVPLAWKEQLKEGGIMVLPIGNSLWRFIKTGPDAFQQQEYPGFLFVPFVGEK